MGSDRRKEGRNGRQGDELMTGWTKSGYRYITLEHITWIDFRPCYRCRLPSSACPSCNEKSLYLLRNTEGLKRQREGVRTRADLASRGSVLRLCSNPPAALASSLQPDRPGTPADDSNDRTRNRLNL